MQQCGRQAYDHCKADFPEKCRSFWPFSADECRSELCFLDRPYEWTSSNSCFCNILSFMSVFVHYMFGNKDGLTGSAWGDWSLYTASPLRAFEDETGVQPPFGYWDPLGLSADGSSFNFNRRREVLNRQLVKMRSSITTQMCRSLAYSLPLLWSE